MLTRKLIMLLVHTRSIAFNDPRWRTVCMFVCLFVCLFLWAGHLVSSSEFLHIGTCAFHDITYKQSVIYLLVICSFLRKIKTMTIGTSAAHNCTKEPGGTMLAIRLILMACILMVHILLMPMASNGPRSEVSTILWNARRLKLKPNSKSLQPGSSNILAQEQLFLDPQ